MDEMPSIVGYCRVSTREQSENSAALEQQIARVKAAGAIAVLVDVESGRSDERSEFQRLMQLVKDRAIARVVVTRLDRLTRSLPTLRKTLDEFQSSGVALVALDDAIDMSTAAGKFHINMLGSLAEMESDRLSERIRRGKEHFRQQQRASHPPFGYITRNYKHELDREPFLSLLSDRQTLSRADMARDLIDAYLTLQSLGGTVRYFVERYGYQEFWQSALRRWLTSPVLRGHLVYYPKSSNPEIHYNTHDPLIAEEESQNINQIIQFNHKIGGFGHRRGRYPLTGLVKCDCCGGGCIVANGSKGFFKYFVCAKSRSKACTCNRGVRMERLEEAVFNALVSRADEIAAFADCGTEYQSPELAELYGQLAVLETLGDNPAIVEAREKLALQIESLNFRSESRAIADEGLRDLLLQITADLGFWEELTPAQKQRFLRSLVEAVVIRDGDILRVALHV